MAAQLAPLCAAAHLAPLLRAALAAGAENAPPGTVLDDRLRVACGEGASALRVIEAQRGGRAAMETPAFLRGFPIPKGTRLG